MQVLVSADGVPSGGRNPCSPRLARWVLAPAGSFLVVGAIRTLLGQCRQVLGTAGGVPSVGSCLHP